MFHLRTRASIVASDAQRARSVWATSILAHRAKVMQLQPLEYECLAGEDK